MVTTMTTTTMIIAGRLARAAAAALLLLAGTASAGQAQDGRPADGDLAVAVFAGGCFWCVEEAFDKVEGVRETVSGFTGGTVPKPSYERVSRGGTGHAEAVRVRYDPATVSYAELLEVFWHNVDPLDGGGQFCDRGDQYRSAIFPGDAEERRLAEASKAIVAERFNRPVATTIETAAPFFAAEDYHQDYHLNNPLRYRYYKWRCGRAERLEALWGPAPAGDIAVAIAP